MDLAVVRDRLDLPASVISDDELDEIVAACAEMQAARTIPPVTGISSALERALLRRVAREVAAKGMPLGAQNTEWGSFYIPGWNDPILASLEADHLAGGFA
jgi:hypothetical protein